jgi:Peptidase family M28
MKPLNTVRLACLGMMLSLVGALHAQPFQDVPSDEAIHQNIEKIVSFGVRLPGSEASRQTSDFVHQQFTDSGLQRVSFEEADTLVWRASRWGLAVNGQPLPCSPMQHTFHTGVAASFTTGPDGLNAPLVYVGKGSAWDFALQDVRGKIVVADVPFSKKPAALLRPFTLGVYDPLGSFPWDYQLVDPYSAGDYPYNYYRAMAAGAAGFAGILVDNFDSHQYRNEAYRSYAPGLAMSMPGLWLSPVQGAALVKQIKAARASKPLTSLMANFRLDGQLTKETGRGVYGYLPGMSDEIVLVESHHDSATSGAVEDASGASEVMALARYFGQFPKEARARTLMFATMDTHFTDYAVHKAFAKRHLRIGNPAGENVVAVVTIEHIGNEFLKGPDGQLKATGRVVPRALMVSTEVKGFRDIALNAMRSFGLDRTFAVSTSMVGLITGGDGIPADSSGFLEVGVPVIAFVGAPLYLYDEADTLDKVAKQELNRVARAFVHVVQGVSALPSANFKRLPDKAAF